MVEHEETCCLCGQVLPPEPDPPENPVPVSVRDKAKVVVALVAVPLVVVGAPVMALAGLALFVEWAIGR